VRHVLGHDDGQVVLVTLDHVEHHVVEDLEEREGRVRGGTKEGASEASAKEG
jgi:hypothetical protein